MRASVIIPTHRPAAVLTPCLRALAAQTLPADDFEVLAVYNGAPVPRDLDPGAWPFDLLTDALDEPNIAAAKNVAIERARGELLVLLNDDVIPEPNFLAAHLAAHQDRTAPAMVLGRSDWVVPADETIFDRMIRTTSMVFFYDQMTPHTWHGFRHAWNLNLSLPRELLGEQRFDEALGPFFFEDIELAWRLERTRGVRVWYEPAARLLHDHRYTLEGYLKREEALGAAAVRLWRSNPACYRDVYGRDLDENELAYCAAFVQREETGAAARIDRLRSIVVQPADRLPGGAPQEGDVGEIRGGPGEAPSAWINLLYDAHLPLKRLHFRCGLLAVAKTPHAGSAAMDRSPQAQAAPRPGWRPDPSSPSVAAPLLHGWVGAPPSEGGRATNLMDGGPRWVPDAYRAGDGLSLGECGCPAAPAWRTAWGTDWATD